MKKILLFLIIIFSCSSLKINSEIIEGVYILGNGVYGNKLVLKENYKFEYNWAGGLLEGKTLGDWKIEEDFIILNSELQPRDEAFKNQYKILKSEFKHLDSIQIKVLDENRVPMQNADCYLKKNDSVIYNITSNSQGIAKLPKMKADSLCVSFSFYDYVSIPLNNFHKDEIILELNQTNQSLEFYQFFTNEKFKYRRNKLIGSSTKYSKFE